MTPCVPCAWCAQPIDQVPIEDDGVPYHCACLDRRADVLRPPTPEELADLVVGLLGEGNEAREIAGVPLHLWLPAYTRGRLCGRAGARLMRRARRAREGAVKRTLRICLAVLIVTIAAPVAAQPRSGASSRAGQPSSKIAILSELVDVLGAAGDALKRLTDGIRHLVVTGVEGYDAASARVTHSRLVELSQMTERLTRAQGSFLVTLDEYLDAHDEYLAERNKVKGRNPLAFEPSDHDWANVMAKLGPLLGGIRELLQRVERERSDFVLRPAYDHLVASLDARVSLITRLAALPQPQTRAEIAVLRKASARYGQLVTQLRAARTELNAYLIQHKNSTSGGGPR